MLWHSSAGGEGAYLGIIEDKRCSKGADSVEEDGQMGTIKKKERTPIEDRGRGKVSKIEKGGGWQRIF